MIEIDLSPLPPPIQPEAPFRVKVCTEGFLISLLFIRPTGSTAVQFDRFYAARLIDALERALRADGTEVTTQNPDAKSAGQ